MNTSTEHILHCNQSEPLADASGRLVDLMNENAFEAEPGAISADIRPVMKTTAQSVKL